MSKDKAINGSVKVVIDRQEFWVRPEELLINGKPLSELESEVKVLNESYSDFRENTLKTLEKLIVSDKQNKKLIDQHAKALENFMAQVIKGGF